MFARQSLKSASTVLGAAVVSGGAAYASYSYLKGPQQSGFLSTAYAESPAVNTVAPKKTFTGFGFTDLKLESVEVVNHNVKKLRFALPDEDAVSGLSVVSSLLSKHTPEGKWLPVVRPYTPISDPDEPGHVTLLIKQYPNGKASGHLHSLVPGQTMSFQGPLKEFAYTPNVHSHITVIAGGSGITPLYQLTRSVFKNPEDTTKVTLVFGVNSEEDLLMKSEFDELERKFPDRFNAVYTVSKPTGKGWDDSYYKGYITKEMLEKVMPDPKNETNAKVLVSGPPPMQTAIAGKNGFLFSQGAVGGILAELGYTKDQVYKF